MATFQDFKLQDYCNEVIKELGFQKANPNTRKSHSPCIKK